MNLPVLHVVATDTFARGASFASVARGILRVGGSRVALHLRLKRASARTVYDLARAVGSAASEAGGWCVVNGRVDVALCTGSQAVQLGFGALPVPAVRQLVGDRMAIGASVHSEEAARVRADEGADYLVAGSVFETPTHPEARPAGVDIIGACGKSGAPVIAIGGIGPETAATVMRAGASGIAVVRAVWSAEDPVSAATGLLEILSENAVPERPASRRQEAGRPVEGGV